MNNYFEIYNNLTKIVIYDFNIGDGGIGDCFKFYMYALDLCIKNNYKLLYLINNIPLESYLKLKMSDSYNMYITKDQMLSHNINNIKDMNEFMNITDDFYHVIKPELFYPTFTFNDIKIPVQDVFYFTEEIILNSQLVCKYDNYISLHLRLGDKYLETEASFIQCIYDVRNYNEERIFEFIENNKHENIIFFCDNNSYKLKLKEKYDHIIIINSDIGHTSLRNTTIKQTIDGLSEFYIMTNSNRIYCGSYSGFSTVASLYKRIPLINL
jgi:hypothetical protein